MKRAYRNDGAGRGEGRAGIRFQLAQVVGQHEEGHAQVAAQLALHLGQKGRHDPFGAVEAAVDAAAGIRKPVRAAVLQRSQARGFVSLPQLRLSNGTQPATNQQAGIRPVGNV